MLRAGFDYQYRGVKEYINRGRDFLEPGGKLLLGTGGFADLNEINSYAEQCGYHVQEIARKTFPIEHGSDLMLSYIIFEYDYISEKR